MSLFTSTFMSCVTSLCRLLQTSADIRTFPVLSLSIFLEMSDPIPRCSSKCISSFLPSKHRPSPGRQRIGRQQYPHSNFSVDSISGLQIFSYVQTSQFARHPGCSHFMYLHKRPVTFTSKQNTGRYLAVHWIC